MSSIIARHVAAVSADGVSAGFVPCMAPKSFFVSAICVSPLIAITLGNFANVPRP